MRGPLNRGALNIQIPRTVVLYQFVESVQGLAGAAQRLTLILD